MEYVTPEEIAETVVFELKGGNTGHDIINALDHATLEPTYRAGYMQNFAISKMKKLEKEYDSDSVAFEMLDLQDYQSFYMKLRYLKFSMARF